MMTKNIRFTLVAFIVATTGCAASAADDTTGDDAEASLGTTEQAQTREQILLARQVGLTSVARSMGTSDGRIVVADAAGAQKSFVLDRAIYVAGAPVYASSRYELCSVGRAGLTSCSAIGATPESTGVHECDEDACWCEGTLNCLGMLVSAACDTGTLECDDDVCACKR